MISSIVLRPGDKVLVTVDGGDDSMRQIGETLFKRFPGVEFVITNEIAQVVPYVDDPPRRPPGP